MARGAERQLELLVLQELKKAGYPEDSIVTDWRYRNNIFDFVIVDKTTDIPLMIIECKHVNNQHSLDAVANQLRRYSDSLDYPVRTCAAVSTGESKFDFYDFTEKIKNPDLPISECGPTDIPSYNLIKTGVKSKLITAQKKRKKKYINGLRIVCWGIIPLVVLAVAILDAMGVYELNTERLIMVGIFIISILLPFFGEIKLGDLTLTHKKKEEEK